MREVRQQDLIIRAEIRRPGPEPFPIREEVIHQSARSETRRVQVSTLALSSSRADLPQAVWSHLHTGKATHPEVDF
jgi:hypothetical protein